MDRRILLGGLTQPPNPRERGTARARPCLYVKPAGTPGARGLDAEGYDVGCANKGVAVPTPDALRTLSGRLRTDLRILLRTLSGRSPDGSPDALRTVLRTVLRTLSGRSPDGLRTLSGRSPDALSGRFSGRDDSLMMIVIRFAQFARFARNVPIDSEVVTATGRSNPMASPVRGAI